MCLLGYADRTLSFIYSSNEPDEDTLSRIDVCEQISSLAARRPTLTSTIDRLSRDMSEDISDASRRPFTLPLIDSVVGRAYNENQVPSCLGPIDVWTNLAVCELLEAADTCMTVTSKGYPTTS